MHVVTFYSFKGGVGRTMALINAAVNLMQRGRRVLIVDFDLEAPGIQTYEPFTSGIGSLGVVDYVTKYIESGTAPDVNKYIVEHSVNGGSIWLMPAGRDDGDYARRLHSIDWLTLYNEFDGYLMFEDLKQQWKSVLNFDYVLIDSRTGHTDVGGICTRQLPDANVLMFFPNDQNLSGLEEVVRNIRLEATGLRKKTIQLHFCPSNVPDLDDEEQILRRHLEEASQTLEYDQPASIIHHYNSLALLDQTIFVKDRPMTRLADQYRQLVDAIIAENLEDKSGALSRLEQIRINRDTQDLPAIEETLRQIYTNHKEDGEVAWSLSLVYEMLGDVEAQLETLGIAIDRHVNEARARTKRASLLHRDSQAELVREDLRAVILASDVSVKDLINSVERLRKIDPEWTETVDKAEAIRKLRGTDLRRFADALMVDRLGARFAAKLLKDRNELDVRTELIIALIGAGEFQEAMRRLGDRTDMMRSSDIVAVFNLACAEWGHRGEPPRDLFAHVAELFEGETSQRADVNYLQCLSMTYYILNEYTKAREIWARARHAVSAMPPALAFSCWRYLNVKRIEMRADLEEMRLQMKTRAPLIPSYLQQPSLWAAAGSKDTALDVKMEPEVGHGATEF
jgi:cellulose biosynthesis protein BcsQ